MKVNSQHDHAMTDSADIRLLIVGNSSHSHLGGYLYESAQDIGIDVKIADTKLAFGSRYIQAVYWRYFDRLPSQIAQYERKLLAQIQYLQPTHLLATGLAPIRKPILQYLQQLGIKTLNYLTDDPWNPVHWSSWFQQALSLYDCVYTPRRSNIDDLINHGVPRVNYLPFAYTKNHVCKRTRQNNPPIDIIFVGGADPDRIPIITALINAGFSVLLVGGYWNRIRRTSSVALGFRTCQEILQLSLQAKITLILPRHANRDGHVMRSYEAAASANCLLVEWTEEHEQIYGPDEKCVAYFKSLESMITVVRRLIESPDCRNRLGLAVQEHITWGHNTYKDRLRTILGIS